VLFLVVERLEFSLFVNLWEHPPVLEYFERPHPRVASVFQHQEVSLVVHFLHLYALVVPWRLRNFTSFALIVLYLLWTLNGQLSNRFVMFVISVAGAAITFIIVFNAIFLILVACGSLQEGCLRTQRVLLSWFLEITKKCIRGNGLHKR